jgi:hypothetical protein
MIKIRKLFNRFKYFSKRQKYIVSYQVAQVDFTLTCVIRKLIAMICDVKTGNFFENDDLPRFFCQGKVDSNLIGERMDDR